MVQPRRACRHDVVAGAVGPAGPVVVMRGAEGVTELVGDRQRGDGVGETFASVELRHYQSVETVRARRQRLDGEPRVTLAHAAGALRVWRSYPRNA